MSYNLTLQCGCIVYVACDPKTGQCTTISSAVDVKAVPAFVNDIPSKQKIASK